MATPAKMTAMQKISGRFNFEPSQSHSMSAAKGAGLTVVGLTTTLAADRLLAAGAEIAVADFADPRILPLIEARMAAPGKKA